MALLGNISIGGIGLTSGGTDASLIDVSLGIGGTAQSQSLLSVGLDPLLSLNIGAGGATPVIALDGSVGTMGSTSASPVINLGLDLGTGTTGGNGGLLGGLLGGGSAGGGDGLIPTTVDGLLQTVTDLTGTLLGTGSGGTGAGSGSGGTGGTPSNPGTPGQVINGTGGPDLLQGTSGNDTISGLGGNDIIFSNGGNDIINGGAGRDTVVLTGSMSQYTAASENGVIGFHNTATGDTSFLMGVERVNFSDHILALDFNGDAGQAFRLYQAEFNRVPDTPGLTHNVQLLDNGTINLHDLANAFVSSPEALQTYGANTTNEQFVTNLYHNTLHREPDAVGFQNWTNALNAHTLDRGSVLLGFSESTENHNQTDHQLQNGILLDYGIA